MSMFDNPKLKEVELIYVIINYGKGSKVLKIAKEKGILGGTIIIGKGTVRNSLLKFLDLNEIRREIVLMLAEKDVANAALEALDKKINFNKPHNGIAFTTSVTGILGSKSLEGEIDNERGAKDSMHKLIITIVDKGNAEMVVEAATKAGSKGGTIINARGSGIHETCKVFGIEVEPEKELVLILAEKDLTEAIALSIKDELNIDEPGKGIIFILDVNKTYGLA